MNSQIKDNNNTDCASIDDKIKKSTMEESEE